MRYLLNALPNSLLIPETIGDSRIVVRLSQEQAVAELDKGFVSAIGHEATARALSTRTGLNIEYNRITVVPGNDDVLIVAAVVTPRRLPEGELYADAEVMAMPIAWAMVIRNPA